ncbi:MAG TPA: MBL fold metallo-hydrolase [Bacteroidales bacterium]|nr:MBL fold metallo-hydrolase [Bacteroidales bacterium]
MQVNSSRQYIKLSLGITNCFLIPCGDNYLLVDTSTEKYYKKFKQELSKRSIDLSQISFIFLTHHHTDHTGFLSRLLEETNAMLIVHEKALPFLEKGIDNYEMTGTTALIRFMVRLKKFFRLMATSKAVIPGERAIIIDSDNNDLLRYLHLPAKIVTLPGHTGDSMSIICDDGNAFIGDAAMNILGFLKLRHRPLVAENPLEIESSWKKIKFENGKLLHVSHGKFLTIETLISS